MKRIICIFLSFLFLVSITGCRLSYKKVEGVWQFSEVNGAGVAQYAAVTGRTTADVAHSYTISGKTVIYEDISGETELKLTMTEGGFIVIADGVEKAFDYNEEQDVLIFLNGDEEWIYKR